MASDDERPAKQRYPTLVSFYRADPVRLTSRERDVGLWWRASGDGPMHRAAWIEETGELYLVRLGTASEGGGAVEVIGRARDGEELERALSGWREHCGMPGSLQWLRVRAARLASRTRAGGHRIAPGAAGAALV